MTKQDRQQDQLDNVSTGGHLGGTHFGQTQGDAKTKNTRDGGDKARPNDGKN
ncbi:hypothetical protein SAMN05216456_0817 [Devosia crocina]|uniref:Uncharacterized protein n=1 Tax=Devosia crocina TaxID=429728 RepID=A0A1I7N547_9HYPH|nr:hypothetical protein [Devosia crocina]SFV29703.1 hypothetical protein SAMN05216456_0817 [Devosia crocina]